HEDRGDDRVPRDADAGGDPRHAPPAGRRPASARQRQAGRHRHRGGLHGHRVAPARGAARERVKVELGRLRGERPGATVILVGGIHGNEPAGVEACRRLLARVDARAIAGEVVAFAGNPAALAAGRRYLARDMNRQWTPALLTAARAIEDAESAALLALADAIDDLLAGARGPVFALDLHT